MIKIPFLQKSKRNQSVDDWLLRRRTEAANQRNIQMKLSKLLESAPKETAIAAIDYYKYLKLCGVDSTSACQTVIDTYFR